MSSRGRRGSVASARRRPAGAPAPVGGAAAPGAPVHLRQRYTAHEAGVKREVFSVARPRPAYRPPGLILLGRGELRDGQEAKAGPGRHPGEVLVSGEEFCIVRHGESRDEAVDRRHRHATGGGSSRLARPLIVMPRIELHGAEGLDRRPPLPALDVLLEGLVDGGPLGAVAAEPDSPGEQAVVDREIGRRRPLLLRVLRGASRRGAGRRLPAARRGRSRGGGWRRRAPRGFPRRPSRG